VTGVPERAWVVGLGLIGGSLARELVARGVEVVGWDADPATLRAAALAGVVPGGPGAAPPDTVVLAVPVGDAPEALRRLAPEIGGARLITDAGSTKRRTIAAAEALGLGERFVGAHPMAGDHRGGWAASRPGLFRGARVYLVPTRTTTGAAAALARALWEAVGGRCETMGAAEHDRRVAWTSHLPQAVSSALGAVLSRRSIGPGALGPGGRDVLRLAGSPAATWADIATDNADELEPALAALEAELGRLRAALGSGDRDRVEAWFAAGGAGASTSAAGSGRACLDRPPG
jgi:prephenate dehydrogenase